MGEGKRYGEGGKGTISETSIFVAGLKGGGKQ